MDLDTAEVRAFLSKIDAELRSAHTDQQQIDQELKMLIEVAPIGVPLNQRESRIVEAAMEARRSFENLRSVSRRVRESVERLLGPGSDPDDVSAGISVPAANTFKATGCYVSLGIRHYQENYLTQLVGAKALASLMRRAVTLACVEAPLFQDVRVAADGLLEGIEDQPIDAQDKVANLITTHLLTLLGALIGEPLTLRLARDVWSGHPDRIAAASEHQCHRQAQLAASRSA